MILFKYFKSIYFTLGASHNIVHQQAAKVATIVLCILWTSKLTNKNEWLITLIQKGDATVSKNRSL